MAKQIDQLRAFYERRHPEYATNVAHWRFLRACYNGGRNWFTENIFRYIKEGDKEFTDRIARAYRFNHTREVVDLVQKYLFKANIARNVEEAPSEVIDFWNSSTLSGLGINQFIRQAGTGSSISGRVAIVVDNNMPSTVGPISVKQAKALKARVYAYIVQTENILDYAWDEDGDGGLLWVKLREYTRNDADPFNDDGEVVERQRLWTRTDWTLLELVTIQPATGRSQATQETRIIETGEHNLGVVPVVFMDHVMTDNAYFVPSLIEDIAYLDRAVANYLSNLDAIIQDQTFSQLAIPAQNLMPGDDGYDKVLDFGTKRIFVYDAGAGSSASPKYLSPDPKQAGVILSVINKIINEIYHTIGLAGERTKEDNAVGIDNSSGVAKAYDFERVNSLLLSRAAICERVENKIVELVMLWHQKAAPDQDLVTYPDTFDVMRLSDELVTAETLGKIDAPKEVRREQMNALVDKMFPQLKADLRKKITEGVNDWLENADVALTPPSIAGRQSGKTVSAPSRQGQVTANT